MFQGVRGASPFYILYKNEPRVAVGEVVSFSNPVPQFGAYQTAFPAMMVDIKVKVGDETLDFKQLPADQTIADYGSSGMVVSDSREAILNEVANYKKASEKALAEIEHHKHVVEQCDAILADLNPQLRKEAEQAAEIDSLKRTMASLQGDMTDIKGMLSKALGHASSKSKEN